ncbi:hypothetical protein ACTMU2_15510 [Cupriavidus basilensis]
MLLAWAAAPLAIAAGTVQATWPEKPIRLVVAFPPGGPVDTHARLLAEKLQPLLGQTIVLEKLYFALGGNGGISHLMPELFKQASGTLSCKSPISRGRAQAMPPTNRRIRRARKNRRLGVRIQTMLQVWRRRLEQQWSGVAAKPCRGSYSV